MFEMFEGQESKTTPTSYESSDSVHELAARHSYERAPMLGQRALFAVEVAEGKASLPEKGVYDE